MRRECSGAAHIQVDNKPPIVCSSSAIVMQLTAAASGDAGCLRGLIHPAMQPCIWAAVMIVRSPHCCCCCYCSTAVLLLVANAGVSCFTDTHLAGWGRPGEDGATAAAPATSAGPAGPSADSTCMHRPSPNHVHFCGMPAMMRLCLRPVDGKCRVTFLPCCYVQQC